MTNLVKGSVFQASLPVFTGNFRNATYTHDVQIKAEIIKDSYGEKTGQHSFTFIIIESNDPNEFAVGEKYRKMGRNLYPHVTNSSRPNDYDVVAAEKSARAATQSAKAKREAGLSL